MFSSCFRWQDYEANLGAGFRELRTDKEFFDVTLCCEHGTETGREKRERERESGNRSGTGKGKGGGSGPGAGRGWPAGISQQRGL